MLVDKVEFMWHFKYRSRKPGHPAEVVGNFDDPPEMSGAYIRKRRDVNEDDNRNGSHYNKRL